MRSRGLAIGFLIIILAACVGAYAALRLIGSGLKPPGRAWQPPTPTTAISPTTARTGPTTVVVPTPAAPTDTPLPPPTFTPTARPIPSPTPTAAGPTATPTLALPGGYRFLPTGPVRHTPGGCPGQYILGTVRDGRGNPLPNVRLRSTDPWGNEAFATTKSAPAELGRYDFPLFPPGDIAITYDVVVLDETGRPISPVVSVPHHHEGPDKDANCHWLDWQRVE